MAAKTRTDEEKQTILREAKDRFRRCSDWEATARARFQDDLKFAEGDSVNMYQWPAAVQNRLKDRVMLTINRVRQHNLDILNDARQSKVAIKVRPVRGGATYESAQLIEGVIRHIEYISNADAAYQHALAFAVKAGIGWMRIVTDYASETSFDQEIYIRRVPNPLSVYLDPDITEFDGSDATFGFVFTDMSEDAFNIAYPKLKGKAKDTTLEPNTSWVMEDKVRVAEYFRCVQDKDRLVAYTDPNNPDAGQVTAKASEIDKELLALVIDDPTTMVRSIVRTKVEHFTLVGDTIADEKVWPGKYIPLLRCIGEETIIDGQLDRKGHTRALLDQQRMANYNASGAVEFGALQSKSPYITPLAAVEGIEEFWKNANTADYAYLPFKHVDDEGNPIPAPQKQQPPMSSPLYMQAFEMAISQMYLASGQNQADFGQPGNEKSGVAIQQRQRQGDNATYHYLDHQSSMIRYAGKQLIDLIPKVYDTERLVKMRDEAGKETEVKIDPNAPDAISGKEKIAQDAEAVILNPNIGEYDVQSDVGAAYATQRQEAFAAYTQILTQNKELTAIIGDIAMRFADFPGAEEAAVRLRRMVPKQALEDGPSPDVMALQQQLQAMGQVVDGLQAKLADKMADHINTQEKNAVSGYSAQTARLAALKDALPLDPEDLLMLVREVLTSSLQTESALEPALDTTAAVEPTGPAQAAAMDQGMGMPPGPQGAPPEGLPPTGGPIPPEGPPGLPEGALQAEPGGPPVG